MNGSNALPPLMMSNPVVDLLTQLLSEAKAGKISSIGIVAVTPQGGCARAYAGGQRGDVYIGISLLKKQILADIEAPQGRPSILRALG